MITNNLRINNLLKNALSFHFYEVAAIFIIGFIYNYYITGALDPKIFSRYALFILNLNLAISLIEGGLGSAVVRFKIRSLSEINYLVRIQLFIFLIIVIFAFTYHLVTPFLNIYYLYGCIAILFNIISVNFYSALLSYEKFKEITVYRVLSYLLSTIAVVLIVYYGYDDAIFLIFSFRSFFEVIFFVFYHGLSLQFDRPQNLKKILIESRLLASNGLLNSLLINVLFTQFSKISNGLFLSTWNRIDAFVGTVFKQFAGIASKILFPKFVNGATRSKSDQMILCYISTVFILYNLI